MFFKVPLWRKCIGQIVPIMPAYAVGKGGGGRGPHLCPFPFNSFQVIGGIIDSISLFGDGGCGTLFFDISILPPDQINSELQNLPCIKK